MTTPAATPDPDPRERLITELVSVRVVAHDATAALTRAQPLLERLEGYLEAEAADRRARRTWADVAHDCMKSPPLVAAGAAIATLLFQWLTGYAPPVAPEVPDVVPVGVPREP
jgi:hypothetical protein